MAPLDGVLDGADHAAGDLPRADQVAGVGFTLRSGRPAADRRSLQQRGRLLLGDDGEVRRQEPALVLLEPTAPEVGIDLIDARAARRPGPREGRATRPPDSSGTRNMRSSTGAGSRLAMRILISPPP